jgi:hypothetical protein
LFTMTRSFESKINKRFKAFDQTTFKKKQIYSVTW